MQLWHFIVVCLAAAFGLRFFIVPRLARSLPTLAGAGAIQRSGMLAMCGFMASVAQVALVSAIAVWIAIWWLTRSGGSTLPQVVAALEKVTRWRHEVEEMTVFSSWFFLGVVLVGFALYFRRRGKIRASEAIHRAAQREFDRLREKLLANELPPMAPTQEMVAIDQELEKLDSLYSDLTAELAADNVQAAEIRRGIEERASELIGYRAKCDLLRRLNFKLDEEDAALPKARNVWEKIEHIFMSRGLLVNLSRARRMLAYVSLALLLPAFVSLSARVNAPVLESHTARLQEKKIAFEQIELRLQQAKDLAAVEQAVQIADQAWEQTAQAFEQMPEQKLAKEDEEAINILGAKFEFESAARGVWNAALVPRGPIYELKSLSARDRILKRAAAQHPERVTTQASFGEANLSKTEQTMMEMANAEPGPLRPRTSHGRKFGEQLKTVLSHAEADLRMRARVEAAAWRESARASDFQRAILGHFSDVFEGNISAFGDAVEQISETQRDVFRRYERVTINRAAHQWTKGSDVTAAAESALSGDRVLTPGEAAELQRIVRAEVQQLPQPNRVAANFRDHPPALHVVEDRAAISRATEALVEFRAKNSQNAAHFASMADSVVSYDDYFPGQAGADERTAAANIRRGFEDGVPINSANPYGPPSGESGGGGGGGGGGHKGPAPHRPATGGGNAALKGGPKISAPARVSFARARSFTMLRGFSRVGGVLIGREPETAGKLLLTSFGWELGEGNQIRLVVQDERGQTFRSASHRATLVYQALVYAADERPTAITMAKADPLMELKILLHPALIDTALGGNVVELDRFVDKYTGSREDDGFRRKAEERVQTEHNLYLFSWAIRIEMLKSPITEEIKGLKARFEVAEKYREQIDEKSLVVGSGLADPKRSPLAVKNEFYDAGLVAVMKQAATNSDTLDKFAANLRMLLMTQASHVRELFDDSSPASRHASQEDETLIQNWLALPPSFEIWSGVREMEFNPDFNAVFVRDGAKVPASLDFMLQVAFTSDPQFGSARVTRDEDAGTYSDTKPWEFPEIRQRIRDTVHQSLDPEDRVVLANSSEFTILQRFFRLAFLGRFGDDFPVAKLDQLATDLERSVKPAEWTTPRWNPRPGSIEARAFETISMILLVGTEDEKNAAFIPGLQACAALAKKNIERRKDFSDKLAKLESDRKTGNAWQQAWSSLWMQEEADQQGWELEWQKAAEQLANAAKQDAAAIPREIRVALETTLRTTTALKVRRALDVSKDERLGQEAAIGLRKVPLL